MIGPAALAAASNFAINSALVAVAVGLSTGHRMWSVWDEKFRWLWPYYIIIGILAVMTATAYERWEPAGVALLLIPLAMVWFSLRQYAGLAASLARRPERA